MTKKNGSFLIALIATLSLIGCNEDKTPEVVTTPGSSTTVIHDKTPDPAPAPNVTVNTPPPSSTHTETNTTTVPDNGSPSTTTTTKSTTTTTG